MQHQSGNTWLADVTSLYPEPNYVMVETTFATTSGTITKITKYDNNPDDCDERKDSTGAENLTHFDFNIILKKKGKNVLVEVHTGTLDLIAHATACGYVNPNTCIWEERLKLDRTKKYFLGTLQNAADTVKVVVVDCILNDGSSHAKDAEPDWETNKGNSSTNDGNGDSTDSVS